MLALLNNLVPFSLIVYGQTHIASGLASVLNATTPLFTLVVARIFAGEPLTAAKLGGVLLGMAGVGVLMGPDALSADAAGVLGMLCVLGAALSYGLSALWMRRLKGTPPLVSAAAQLVCSTSMLLPVAGAGRPVLGPADARRDGHRRRARAGGLLHGARLHRVLPHQRHRPARATSCW